MEHRPGSIGENNYHKENDDTFEPPERGRAQFEVVETSSVVPPSADDLRRVLSAHPHQQLQERTRVYWKRYSPAILLFLVVLVGITVLADQRVRDATIGRGLDLILG